MPWNAVDVQLDGNREPPNVCGERGLKTIGGEQRRVDAPGKLPQIVQCLIGILLELSQDRTGLALRLGGRLRQPDFDLQCDQVLLGAVVQIALEPAALLILRADQPLTRGAKVVEPGQQLAFERNVLQH